MKQIPLTQNKFAIVDDEDFDKVSQYKWYANFVNGTWYAQTGRGKTAKKMHRLIMGLTDPKILVDHKDRNGLNNQKSNLREATFAQNMANRKNFGESKYIGVTPEKNGFRARIWNNGRTQYIGFFSDEIEAAKAYNTAALKLRGEFANLNKFEDAKIES